MGNAINPYSNLLWWAWAIQHNIKRSIRWIHQRQNSASASRILIDAYIATAWFLTNVSRWLTYVHELRLKFKSLQRLLSGDQTNHPHYHAISPMRHWSATQAGKAICPTHADGVFWVALRSTYFPTGTETKVQTVRRVIDLTSSPTNGHVQRWMMIFKNNDCDLCQWATYEKRNIQTSR